MIDLQAIPPPFLSDFIRGQSRDTALELADAFCNEQIGRGHPCVITGGDGNGKTFLLQAVKSQLLLSNPGQKITLVPERLSTLQLSSVAKSSAFLIDNLALIFEKHNGFNSSLDLIGELLQNGKRILAAGELETESEEVQLILSRWPGTKMAEISAPTLSQKLELAAMFAPHIKMKVLNEIAKQSRSMREVGGWLVRYEACVEAGDTFDMDEGY